MRTVASPLPDGINLSSLLDENIAEFGDALAYRYVDYSQDSDGRRVELTWDQVGTRSRAIGARLQQVTSRGDRVAILAPQGLDYVTGFFAAIQAGNIAVPLFAPELPGHAERLDAVLTDALPAAVLTTTSVGDAVQKFVRLMPREKRPRIIAVDAIPDSVGSTFAPSTWTPTTSPTFSTPRVRPACRPEWRSATAPRAQISCRWSSPSAWRATSTSTASAGCRCITTWG